MNYTGNPRHLRRGPRSSHKGLGARNRQTIPATRPWLDICGSFQKQRDGGATGGDADNSVAHDTTSSSQDPKDGFQSKRRRLLEQGDWLGLEIGAPINIYELRAAKEEKRRANGPFMRPLFSQPSNSSTISPPPRTTPSLASRSPAPTSHSSTSLLPQASIPSVHTSQAGSAFVPSYHTTPVNTNRHSSPSKSSCSSSHSWNSFFKPSTPSVSDLEFIPGTREDEVGFFPQQMEEGETVDMRRVWNLIEERKREDSLLRRELGWGSQSGVSASVQQSQPVVRQSPEGLGGMEDEQVVEKAGREEELIVLANVDTNGMIEGEKAVSEHEGVKEITNIAEQDEEDGDVGLPWF